MTLDFMTLTGITCVAISMVLVAFSRYRYWLIFMLAGVLFWSILELLRIVIQSITDLSMITGYICAAMLMFMTLTLMLFKYDQRQERLNHQKVKCIEHTPVHEDDQHQYSG